MHTNTKHLSPHLPLPITTPICTPTSFSLPTPTNQPTIPFSDLPYGWGKVGNKRSINRIHRSSTHIPGSQSGGYFGNSLRITRPSQMVLNGALTALAVHLPACGGGVGSYSSVYTSRVLAPLSLGSQLGYLLPVTSSTLFSFYIVNIMVDVLNVCYRPMVIYIFHSLS